MYDSNERENIAETLARELPRIVITPSEVDPSILLAAIPGGQDVKTIDLGQHLPNPRLKSGTVSFSDAPSFLAYISRHRTEATVVWVDFNPQSCALSFTAIIDDHATAMPGWRKHRAKFTPAMSVEWQTWKGKDGKTFDQAAFAEFIEANSPDISAGVSESTKGFPTDLQMLEMATNFSVNEDRTLKSAIKLQSGGVRLEYIADVDKGTTEQMQMFQRFAIGIPVFQDGSAWEVIARLKYRQSQGNVSFFYDLIRTDRVHQSAALRLIDDVRQGLDAVPLFLGNHGA